MKRKPIIILVVGTSGSGKTHLTHYLKEKHNIPFIVSYTTRKIRDNETDGVDHHFITPDQIPDKSLMLAHTVFGDYEYFTLKSQVDDLPISSYVVDEDGVRFFRERFAGHYDVFPIYVTASEKVRLARGVSQERMDRDKKRELLPDKSYEIMIDSSHGTESFEHIIEIVRDAVIKKFDL